MNVKQLSDNIKYDDILERNTIDGKIQWAKIALFETLPPCFIEEHFDKLKNLGIEKNQNLDESFIALHGRSLNWYSLLKYQNLSEDTLKKFLDHITKLSLWPLLLKTQNVSYQFLIDNLSSFKDNKLARSAIMQNGSLSDSIKEKICSFLL